MFPFRSKLPVSDDEREWVDEGFRRLEEMLGRRRMLEADVVLPNDDYFPDYYDRSPQAVDQLFTRICAYLKVDRAPLELEVFPDEIDELRQVLPYWSGGAGKCSTGSQYAGFYQRAAAGGDVPSRPLVALRNSLTKDPSVLIATIAHELGHVILIGGKLIDATTPDHEPLTDLLTVFLGFGIFNANSSARFRQYQEAGRQGWSMNHLGYLPQNVFGYAVAKFAFERNELKPAWSRHLSTNVKAYFAASMKWLQRHRA